MKLGIFKSVGAMTIYRRKSTWRSDNLGSLGARFGYLDRILFPVCFFIGKAPSPNQWTDLDDASNDTFLHNNCLWGPIDTDCSPFIGSNSQNPNVGSGSVINVNFTTEENLVKLDKDHRVVQQAFNNSKIDGFDCRNKTSPKFDAITQNGPRVDHDHIGIQTRESSTG